jgi:hypothetical protein
MLRITPLTLHSKEAFIVGDCATGGDSTSGGTLTGGLIDRLALGHAYTHAHPQITGEIPGTTSTAGRRWVTLNVKIKHGDSSGGGDLVDFATGLIADALPFYTTQGESTDWKSWSTGLQRMQYSPKCYPLMGAKRFIAVAGTVTRVGAVTATAAANLFTGSLHLSLLNQSEETSVKFSVAPGNVAGTIKTTSTAT